ncbi:MULTISPECIES: DUF309 domain-containing protein [Haloferax]|uniref:DUF309 domain-containing protein n=2 Tax=Haloferax TaxID=2251 RepID=A0A6G1YYE8_9EURY|nr:MULTISPECIES: DUF309 domain-containing protein [Haloferax]KAB1186691.1 DUF309 domain-containing protein [Haloferax sp. CBA1149]MRW79312.1 DUF309 domain-containing protein [Haloferax marinisediminis]
MDDSLRAGVAIYNAGAYRAAHGAWESTWLALEDGSDDERFLHGLIQFTAAIHHARERNYSGATGLAESAQGYLDGLPDDYRGVNLDDVRTSLSELESDPDSAARDPLVLRLDGHVVTVDDLDFDAIVVAADTLAEELDGYDESVVADAIDYAREEIAEGAQTQFTAMVFDFVQNDAQRGLVYQRLEEHVRRKRRREDDVSGLFE